MGTLNWQRRFESGNRSIDIQHRELFEKISSCIDTARQGSAVSAELIDRLRDIQHCLVEHFKYEEMLMNGAGHEVSDHKSQHNYIAGQLDDELVKFSDKADGRNSAQGILFNLHDWYMVHLEAEDDFWRNNHNPAGCIN